MNLDFRVFKDIMRCLENEGISPNEQIYIEITPFSDYFSIGTKDKVVKYDYATRKMVMVKREVVSHLDCE